MSNALAYTSNLKGAQLWVHVARYSVKGSAGYAFAVEAAIAFAVDALKAANRLSRAHRAACLRVINFIRNMGA